MTNFEVECKMLKSKGSHRMAQGMKKVGKALGGTKQYNKNKGKEQRVGGAQVIKQKKQVKGLSRQKAVKLDKVKTGMIHNNIEELIAAKVTLAGGKLAMNDLRSKGKERLKQAKELLEHKQSGMKDKTTAVTDSIIKRMDREEQGVKEMEK